MKEAFDRAVESSNLVDQVYVFSYYSIYHGGDQWDILQCLWETLSLSYYGSLWYFWLTGQDPNCYIVTYLGAVLILISMFCLQFFTFLNQECSVMIQMIYSMMYAVCTWLGVFVTFFLFPISVFLYVMFQVQRADVPAGYTGLGDSLVSTFFLMLGAYGDTDALYRSVGSHSPIVSELIRFTIVILGLMVLTNMLIAMLTTRYDSIREASEVQATLNYSAMIGQLERFQTVWSVGRSKPDWSHFEGESNVLEISREECPPSLRISHRQLDSTEAPPPDSHRLEQLSHEIAGIAHRLEAFEKNSAMQVQQLSRAVAKVMAGVGK